MRNDIAAIEHQCQVQLLATAGALVYADTDGSAPCGQCGGPMHVRKTLRRNGQTLEHGAFRARETVRVCIGGCSKKLAAADGSEQTVAVIRRSPALAQILLPRRAVGYDVMVFVGLERFVRHRQREEIQAVLKSRYGVGISTGEISTLTHDFVVYLEALHEQRAPALRAALEQDGGWPMHIDATGEDGQGTLLAVYAGWRLWVLGSWKIPTERADAILPRLHQVADRFGEPCAIMRDLGRAMIEASREFVTKRQLKIPVLGCHFHFLKDVGKDLLKTAHEDLHTLLRRFKVISELRALVRDLGRQIGAEIATVRTQLDRWLTKGADGHELPSADCGLAAVRVLAQHVLDYPNDGTDDGFPFDLPYLDLWRRCHTVLRAVEAFLRTPGNDTRIHKALERLHRIVEPVRSQASFQDPVASLEIRGPLFTELREALRLQAKSTPNTPPLRADAKTLTELRDIRQAVDDLTTSLRARRPERGPAQDTRKAIDLILDHLERHGPSLWGHAICLPQQAGGGIRLVDRTNLLLEGFFHGVKHGERRRSGRKLLTQDLEHFPGSALLANNLTQPDYVAILCGSLHALPRVFAQLDADDRRLALPLRRRVDSEPDIVSSSMPAADRDLIRSDGLRELVLAAARSRAPYRAPTGRPREATVG